MREECERKIPIGNPEKGRADGAQPSAPPSSIKYNTLEAYLGISDLSTKTFSPGHVSPGEMQTRQKLLWQT
jgi:hypothetical protein